MPGVLKQEFYLQFLCCLRRQITMNCQHVNRTGKYTAVTIFLFPGFIYYCFYRLVCCVVCEFVLYIISGSANILCVTVATGETRNSSSYICHGVGPLVDPFRSHVSPNYSHYFVAKIFCVTLDVYCYISCAGIWFLCLFPRSWFLYTWRSWIRASWYNYEHNQRDATIYRVSIKSFPCYKHLLQEIYVE
jgi:hypothetical protein